MSATLLNQGAVVPLSLQLFDGNSAQFPQALVRNADGTANSTVNLTHTAGGLYQATSFVMPNKINIKIIYTVFSDVSHTILNTRYERANDVFIKIPDLQAILDDTNQIQGKLPTNNIMGSSVKTDKDDEIDAIKAKTDNLPASPAAISDIPTAGQNADAVLDELLSAHTTVGSLGKAIANIEVDTNEIQTKLPTNNIMGSSVKTDKDDEIDAIKAKTDNLPASPAAINDIPTVSQISDGVWDELQAGHTIVGSFGKFLDTEISGISVPTAAVIADAVLDELLLGHTTPGSLGKAIADIETDTNEIQGKLPTGNIADQIDLTIVRKIVKNRIKHAGTSAIIFDDNDIDAFLTFQFKNDTGGVINSNIHAANTPVERTKAV